jgi:rhamnosyl/mannosyltransferase
MRVLHVYRTYFPESHGGLEEVIRQICSNCGPLGIESRVLCVSRATDPTVIRRTEAAVYRSLQTFEVASCNVSLQAFSMYKRLASWADVVHYHFPWPFADLLHMTSSIKRPSVLTYHSDIVRQRLLSKIYSPVMNRFLRSVDRIVCTSPNYFATSDVLSRFGSKVSVVPIGLDSSTYPEVTDDEIDVVRQQYGENFFLFVGVLRYYKGLHILLDAIKDAPYNVVITGSGPTERELKKQAATLQLDNVKFTGYVPDKTKVALFKLSRGIVFPSYLRAEAFGVTLLEGAMYAKPLISTEVGSGTSHVNIEGETGLVVTPGSSNALRHAMDQLYSRPEMAQLMGKRARKRYEQLFTGELMGRRYNQLYQELASERGQPEARTVGVRD